MYAILGQVFFFRDYPLLHQEMAKAKLFVYDVEYFLFGIKRQIQGFRNF
jgi:hypothetical protein